MAYQVFARKYRPLTFDQILGQDHVVETLRNAIERDRIAQAYLFVGPRGTGKTTTARVLAKALNCTDGPRVDFDPHEDICEEIAEGNSLDVLEIDGASNNGVEQVRELRDNAKFAPARGRFKIYYIDEVHMLTTAAFNALLKTLEEPPPHVKFIFATTEPNKILPTILSRCQRFDLRPLTEPVIAAHLLHIASEEGIDLDPQAAQTVAKGAEGGMRDAQSMLDQLVAFCGNQIQDSHVLDIFGFTAHETVANLTTAILEHRTVDALNTLHTQTEAGKDLTRLLADLITYFRNLLVFKVDPANALADKTEAVAETFRRQDGLVATDRLLELIDQFAEIDARMRWAPNKKMHFEIGIIKAVQRLQESNLSDVIKVLSGAMAAGVPASDRSNPPAQPAAKASAPAARREDRPPVQPKPKLSSSLPTEDADAVPRSAAEDAEPAPASDAEAVWVQLQRKFPMIFSQAAFGGVDEDRLVVRFHPDDFAMERASTARKDIDQHLRVISGRNLRLDVYIDESVPMGPAAAPPRSASPGDAVASENPPPRSPLPAKKPRRTGGTVDSPEAQPQSPASAETAPPTTPVDEAAFYEDVLIKKALDIFQATLEKKDEPTQTP